MRSFPGFRRGVNLGGWLSQCVSMEERHFDTFITEDDIRTIASWGLDHVRLPIDCDVVFSGEDGTPHERMRHVDACVGWCEKYGLHLVLDLHKTYGFMFDTSALDNPDQLFSDAHLQDVFVHLWEVLAGRYGAKSGLVAFELLNEVTHERFAASWNSLAGRAIGAIRRITGDTWILVGGIHNNSAAGVPLLDAPADRRIVYNFHCYEPLAFTHQKAPWVESMPRDFTMAYPDTHAAYAEAARTLGFDAEETGDGEKLGPEDFERLLRPALDAAIERDVPLYCGEYGVIDQAPPEDTLRWFRDLHAVLEKYGIGRAVWTYRQRDFGITGEHYAPVREELIRQL